MVSTLIHAAITGVGFYSINKKLTSRDECMAAINRYWGYYADPNILKNKQYREMKIHIKQALDHVDTTLESCGNFLNQKEFAIFAAPLRDHFSTKMEEIYNDTSHQYFLVIISKINDVIFRRRTISMLHHIRLIKNQYLLQDHSIRKIPKLIAELAVSPYDNHDHWSKARLYTMMLSSEMELLVPTMYKVSCKNELNIVETNDPNFLLTVFYSAQKVMKQSQKLISLSSDDQFSIKNLKYNELKTVYAFKKLWKSIDPCTYVRFLQSA